MVSASRSSGRGGKAGPVRGRCGKPVPLTDFAVDRMLQSDLARSRRGSLDDEILFGRYGQLSNTRLAPR